MPVCEIFLPTLHLILVYMGTAPYNPPTMARKRVAFFLEETQIDRLHALSQKTGVPQAELIRRFLEAALDVAEKQKLSFEEYFCLPTLPPPKKKKE